MCECNCVLHPKTKSSGALVRGPLICGESPESSSGWRLNPGKWQEGFLTGQIVPSSPALAFSLRTSENKHIKALINFLKFSKILLLL